MTDFRALCAELVELLEDEWYGVTREPSALVNARTALAQPEPQGPTDEEIRDVWSWAAGQDQGPWPTQQHCFARTVLQRWGAPAIEPVPTSERQPGPEDCDAEGRCWWFSPPACGPHTIRPCWTFDSETLEGDTHWLPHWALPMPVVEDADG
jgi:hypothetical protein